MATTGLSPRRLLTPLTRARYRVRQFLRGLRPHLSPDEVGIARALLTEPEFLLFLHAEPRDQRHSMDLHHLLRDERPEVSRDLLVTALLHDVGKGPLATTHRIAFVLLSATSPSLARRIEAEHGAGWRQALWRLRHHARLGAEILATAGSSPRVVELVAAHTSPPLTDDPELAAFICADDRV